MKKIYFLVAALFMATTLSAHGIEPKDEAAADAEQREKNVLYKSRNNKFTLKAGGHADLRVAYDFKGVVNHLDFATSEIPVLGGEKQKLRMDATTSYFWLNGELDGGKLGPVKMVVDLDFRAGSELSYTPRIRCAYINFKGLTLGRNVSTFCDLAAAPMTIDFEQPNSYTFHFATMIRYNHSLLNDKLDLCIAAELPSLNMTPSPYFESISQRVPDFPFYAQYNFGSRFKSHVRLIGVLRDLYIRNTRTGNNTSMFGWGVGTSGHIQFCKPFELFFNGQMGQGITAYMLDLCGQNMDFVPDPENPTSLEARKMWGWQIGAHFNITDNFYLSTGYSEVGADNNMEKDLSVEDYIIGNNYRKGRYMFGSAFWQFTERCQLALEYLHGSRENMDGKKNEANRIQARIRFKF